MNLSQKCQYGLRALFELASRQGEGAIPVSEIAEVQAIPPRFLELILSQLKQAGYVESRRGAQGGYMLAVDPEELAVGEVIRFIDGPLSPVRCLGEPADSSCPLQGGCPFVGLWERAMNAVAGVYDNTTFKDLVEQHSAAGSYVADWCI